MHLTAQRLKALLAIIIPNSNSLNSALLPSARWEEETIGTLGVAVVAVDAAGLRPVFVAVLAGFVVDIMTL
jgi:hypothetical protein